MTEDFTGTAKSACCNSKVTIGSSNGIDTWICTKCDAHCHLKYGTQPSQASHTEARKGDGKTSPNAQETMEKLIDELFALSKKLQEVDMSYASDIAMRARDTIIDSKTMHKDCCVMREALEGFVWGQAYDKLTGKPWQHWIEKGKKALSQVSDYPSSPNL